MRELKDFWSILREYDLEQRTINIFGKDIIPYINRLTGWKKEKVRELEERLMIYSHGLRVVWYIAFAANYLSIIQPKISDKDIIYTILAADMHEVIKYEWPERMLSTPKEEFTKDEERERIMHPEKTVALIKKENFLPEPLYEKILPIILYHHEGYDGKGYPEGKKGLEIPIGARLLAPFDSLDAATTERLYKIASHGREKVKTIDEILEELNQELSKVKDRHFDPAILQKSLKFFRDKSRRQEIEKIHNSEFSLI